MIILRFLRRITGLVAARRRRQRATRLWARVRTRPARRIEPERSPATAGTPARRRAGHRCASSPGKVTRRAGCCATAPQRVIRRTRTCVVWAASALSALVLVLLLIFVLEHGQRVNIGYFGFHGHLALGVAVLFAATPGVLLVVIPGTGASCSCGSPLAGTAGSTPGAASTKAVATANSASGEPDQPAASGRGSAALSAFGHGGRTSPRRRPPGAGPGRRAR
jgi:uncharacterized integral membrane protein